MPIKIKVYPDADVEWLHCIVAHRRKSAFRNILEENLKYDIIGGKIANDATNLTLVAYMSGAYGVMGSSGADEFCISLLLPERLKDQFCFRTDLALQRLTFVGSENGCR